MPQFIWQNIDLGLQSGLQPIGARCIGYVGAGVGYGGQGLSYFGGLTNNAPFVGPPACGILTGGGSLLGGVGGLLQGNPGAAWQGALGAGGSLLGACGSAALAVWQTPQTLAGLGVAGLNSARAFWHGTCPSMHLYEVTCCIAGIHLTYTELVVTGRVPFGSVSLGQVVNMPFSMMQGGPIPGLSYLEHELGHTPQSIMLGPLYIPGVVGTYVGAYLLNPAAGLQHAMTFNWLENWANELGSKCKKTMLW